MDRARWRAAEVLTSNDQPPEGQSRLVCCASVNRFSAFRPAEEKTRYRRTGSALTLLPIKRTGNGPKSTQTLPAGLCGMKGGVGIPSGTGGGNVTDGMGVSS
jgi:hypothetical protein